MIIWFNYNDMDAVHVLMFHLVIISDATNEFLPGDNKRFIKPSWTELNHLKNASLMPGNVWQRVTQKVDVVIVQRRHTADNRMTDDIGAVVLATNTHLQQGHVHPLPRKDVQCHHCQEAEVVRHACLPFILVHTVLTWSSVSMPYIIQNQKRGQEQIYRWMGRALWSTFREACTRVVVRWIIQKLLFHMCKINFFHMDSNFFSLYIITFQFQFMLLLQVAIWVKHFLFVTKS